MIIVVKRDFTLLSSFEFVYHYVQAIIISDLLIFILKYSIDKSFMQGFRDCGASEVGL